MLLISNLKDVITKQLLMREFLSTETYDILLYVIPKISLTLLVNGCRVVELFSPRLLDTSESLFQAQSTLPIYDTIKVNPIKSFLQSERIITRTPAGWPNKHRCFVLILFVNLYE